MKKINHVERVKNADVNDREFYFSLVDQAAGAKEAESIFEECITKLEAHGVSEKDAATILTDYGTATQENGFNAGYDLGFGEGALLAAHGKAS